MNVLLVTTSTNAVRTALERETGVELWTIECTTKKSDTLEIIQRLFQNIVPDLLITYRCPYILPKYIFVQPPLGAFNIHPSLLPKYPGLNPWDDIFRNHEQEGGVTLHQMTECADVGLIISQSSFPIEISDTIDSARLKADQHAASLVRQFVLHFLHRDAEIRKS